MILALYLIEPFLISLAAQSELQSYSKAFAELRKHRNLLKRKDLSVERLFLSSFSSPLMCVPLRQITFLEIPLPFFLSF
jgi:hypothetical protein